MAVERYRNWLFITYPESLPEDWKEIIETRIQAPFYVSPLHDKDKKSPIEYKKPHYHNLVCFKGNKTSKQVNDIIAPLNGTIAIPCEDIGGSLRYLCHLSSPDKAQYNVNDVLCFNGADYMEGIFTISDEKRIKREIKDFIIEHQIYYYSDLSLFASKVNQEWENVIDRNSVFWVSFLKSYHAKVTYNDKSYIDDLEIT